MPEFGLINMNGRLYDPLVGRFLSTDNFVQEPWNSQNFNRYSYCLNNPLMYTDPSGESLILIGALTAIFAVGNTLAHTIRGDINHHGFFNNLWEGTKYFIQGAITGAAIGSTYTYAPSFLGSKAGGIINGIMQGYMYGQIGLGAIGTIGGIFNDGLKGISNGAKLFLGNFYLDENNWAGGFLQGFLRHTWEMPQTIIGQCVSHYFNITGNTDRVDYLGGSTFSTIKVNSLTLEKGMTIGNNIIAWNSDPITGDFDNYVIQKPLYMHEYGHTIDSRKWGPGYLAIGIASLFSAKNDKQKSNPPFSSHHGFWTEKRANKNAKNYFSKYYGVNWNSFYYSVYGWNRIEDVFPTY